MQTHTHTLSHLQSWSLGLTFSSFTSFWNSKQTLNLRVTIFFQPLKQIHIHPRNREVLQVKYMFLLPKQKASSITNAKLRTGTIKKALRVEERWSKHSLTMKRGSMENHSCFASELSFLFFPFINCTMFLWISKPLVWPMRHWCYLQSAACPLWLEYVGVITCFLAPAGRH